MLSKFKYFQSDIGDVNQIFKDLGQMVYEQGEVIDSIEAHVEKTEIFVSEGTGQLRQASQYQVSSMIAFYKLH
jgi:syntaxin 7